MPLPITSQATPFTYGYVKGGFLTVRFGNRTRTFTAHTVRIAKLKSGEYSIVSYRDHTSHWPAETEVVGYAHDKNGRRILVGGDLASIADSFALFDRWGVLA